MSKMIRRIDSKHLLIFWLICLGVFFLYSPTIISNSNVYMGMLIGYIHLKTPILSLLPPSLTDTILLGYVSLRDDYRQLGPNHDGIKILVINAVYFAAAATVLYMLIKRFVKFSQPQTALISALTSAALMLTIGFNVIALNANSTAPVVSSSGHIRPYEVQEGDTCDKIALDYKVSVEGIVQFNALTPDCPIYSGELLQIPFP